MTNEPEDDDEEKIEYIVNDAPDLMQLIDWMFFAGTPIPAPESEETGEEDESASWDDDGQ